MSEHGIRVSDRAPVTTVWLARPERRNAFDTPMLVDYVEALEAAGEHPDVRVILIRAEGGHFCAGWNTSEFAALSTADPEAALLQSHALLERAWAVPAVTVAAVRGVVAGFGVALLHRVHLAVAADTARIVLPEIGFGISAASVLVDLQRSLPRKAALDLLLSGDPVDAARAADLGLVSRVVADDELEMATVALADRIAAMPGDAAATVVRSFRLSEDADRSTAVQEAVRGSARTIRALGSR